MRIARENGQEDKVDLSLSLYLKQEATYQNIQDLLKENQIKHQARTIEEKHLEHNYYLTIDLEQTTTGAWLPLLKNELSKEKELEQPARIYISINSVYDHCGLDIPADSSIFTIQQYLNCPLSVAVITG